MAEYIDLLITDNDLTLDIAGEPLLVDNRDSIAQDIKHLIRESGLLVRVVGERHEATINLYLQELTLLIEDDVRLVPGTVVITRLSTELFFITAITEKFGVINLNVSL